MLTLRLLDVAGVVAGVCSTLKAMVETKDQVASGLVVATPPLPKAIGFTTSAVAAYSTTALASSVYGVDIDAGVRSVASGVSGSDINTGVRSLARGGRWSHVGRSPLT